MKKDLRVLHLPSNIASIPSHTVLGLREIGVDARGLVTTSPSIQSPEGLKVIDPVGAPPWSPLWFKFQGMNLYYFMKWVAWADVIHWYYGSGMLPFGLDLRMIKLLRKPAVVEWLGSDIRIPEVEFEDNPYYKKAFRDGYEYQSESYRKSRRTQKRFVEAGFLPGVIPCMIQYIQKDICPRFYRIGQPLWLKEFVPRFPDPGRKKVLVTHAPSAPVAKGTPAVLKAVEALKKKYDFEFVLIQGIPRMKGLEIIAKSDLFLDQFVLGYYGMAALEAMALGKPVISYVKPPLLKDEPPDLPIVNANPDSLTEVLGGLLRDGQRRQDVGRRSRAYVEAHHDAANVAHQLVEVYREVIAEKT